MNSRFLLDAERAALVWLMVSVMCGLALLLVPSQFVARFFMAFSGLAAVAVVSMRVRKFMRPIINPETAVRALRRVRVTMIVCFVLFCVGLIGFAQGATWAGRVSFAAIVGVLFAGASWVGLKEAIWGSYLQGSDSES